jgi:hypothetical protein
MAEPNINRLPGLSINATGVLKVARYLWSVPVIRWAIQRGLEYGTKKIIEAIRKKRNAKNTKPE